MHRQRSSSSSGSFPLIMAPARQPTRSPQAVQRGVHSGRSGGDYDPDKQGSGPRSMIGPEPRASGKTTLKQEEKQSGKNHDAGKHSMLQNMPLDVLYDVSCGTISVSDMACNDTLDTFRYSLSSARWTYSGCRGQTRLFVMVSRTSPRDWFGSPLSITFRRLNAPLHVPRTWQKFGTRAFYTTRVVWCVRVCIFPHLADPLEQGCGASRAPGYWAARVRICTSCIENRYPLIDNPVLGGFLMSRPRVTVVGGVQDQAVVALSRGKLRSSSQVLPTVQIES